MNGKIRKARSGKFISVGEKVMGNGCGGREENVFNRSKRNCRSLKKLLSFRERV